MSNKNRGRKGRNISTQAQQSRIDAMLDRMAAFHVQQLIKGKVLPRGEHLLAKPKPGRRRGF